MEVVIPSKGRASVIGERTLRWFPTAIVTVEDSEMTDYAGLGVRLLPHPPLRGLPAILNWILGCPDLEGDQLAIVDDDIIGFDAIWEAKPRPIMDPADIMAIVENTAEMASGFGAPLWGFSVNRRPDSNYTYKPFCLNGRVGTFRGFSDRSLRYDEQTRRHDDADLTLQVLTRERVVFRDDRFNVRAAPIYRTAGGSQADYGRDEAKAEEEYLRRKWGKHISFVRSPHHWNESRIHVRR